MKRRRKILIVIGVVFAGVILIPVIRHYQLRAAVESYIAELKAKGEPMELAQVLPPSVPPEQNGAEIFRKAAALIKADESLLSTNSFFGMKMVAPGKAMVCWQQSEIHGYDTTNSWEEVAAAVAQNKETLELLHQFMDRPVLDFQLHYEHGITDLPLTNLCLSESKRAAQRLVVAAICDLHAGDTASAVKKVQTTLAIAKAMQDERLVISELVRIVIAHIALTINWEILQTSNVTDEQLDALQRDLLGMDFIQAAENALMMERVTGQITLAKWRESDSEVQRYLDTWKMFDGSDENETTWERIKNKAKVAVWRSFWSYTDELHGLRGEQVLIDAVRLARTNGSFTTAMKWQENQLHELALTNSHDDVLTSVLSQDRDLRSMLSQSVMTMSLFLKRVMDIETAKQMNITAIALKRYQLKHGSFPAGLDSLTPEFLSAIPRDSVNGQPLQYRLNPNGTFLLYSIGEDDKDNGGDSKITGSVFSAGWQRGPDWVWPQPASAEEIQKYYEEQAKKSK